MGAGSKFSPFQMGISAQESKQEVTKASLRKHAYSSVLKILPPKNESFQIKFLIFFMFLLKT